MKKMKIYIQRIILMGLFLGLASIGFVAGQVFAEEGTTEIKDILGDNTYLMKDGSMWSLQYMSTPIYTKGNIETVIGNIKSGLGLTKDGKIMEWNMEKPKVVEGESGGIKQITEYFWLKSDGTVWSKEGKKEKLSNIQLIAYVNGAQLVALSQSGELLYSDHHKLDAYRLFGMVSDVSSVKAMSTKYDSAALLYESGKVVVYDTFNFDDNAKVIPETVAEDAVHIVYAPREKTDALIVTRKDGTVWMTGIYQKRYSLTERVEGLNDIVRVSGVKDAEHFYAQRSNGTWVKFNEGEVTTVQAPSVSEIKISVSNVKPNVGDQLKLYIQETYSNGAVIKVPANEAHVEVTKPHLLKIQSDGTLKVLGVGETDITVKSDGKSKSVLVSASLDNNLKYSKQVKGITYVPAKSVFMALGGSVTAVNGGLEAKLGDHVVWFKAGNSKATLDGNSIELKAAPIVDKGETLIPAALLTQVADLQIQWDSKWKQVELSDGDATMTVVSAETAGLIKKSAQGNLVKFIGRTYWNNYFLDVERFSKVTVTDIIPDDTGSFVIAFTTGNGQTVTSGSLRSSDVTQILSSDGGTFYNFDPYKKYKWSASIWKQIKAGEVSIGMTKEQVQFSWGNPSGKSVMKESGKTIETWVYSNFDTVGFINGKVVLIWS